jgi:hypothetical protein
MGVKNNKKIAQELPFLPSSFSFLLFPKASAFFQNNICKNQTHKLTKYKTIFCSQISSNIFLTIPH